MRGISIITTIVLCLLFVCSMLNADVGQNVQNTANKGTQPLHDYESDAEFERQIDLAIEKAKEALLRHRKPEGYWDGDVYDTPGLTAQYILYMHFMDMVDKEKERKCVNYLLRIQNPNGSWRIYYGDEGILSYSIQAYFALKVAGIPADHPQMIKAKNYILSQGGAEKANMETRFILALFGKSSWNRAVPIPLRILMTPSWFPFSMYNMAYWIRVTMTSMGIIYYKQPVKDLGKHTDIDELWLDVSQKEVYSCPKKVDTFSISNLIYLATIPLKWLMKKLPHDDIVERAMRWVREHQDKSGDWGGILPPMIYASYAWKIMGYSNDYPLIAKAKEAIERFHIETEDEIIQMSCVSPVWDTVWSVLALRSAGMPEDDPILKKAMNWIYSKQIFVEGDWKIHAPKAKPGMWAFQHYNDYYPDVDDSAVALMALLPTIKDQNKKEKYRAGVEWLYNMQNDDGGWAAFERNIDKRWVWDRVPLNDLDNFVDESTPELTGRILELFGRLGLTTKWKFIRKAVYELKRDQEATGSWKGKWGVNHIYGAFGVLRGLSAIGYDMSEPWVQKCVKWLQEIQKEDGSWGESCKSYESDEWLGRGNSTASQTAWGILSLLSSGVRDEKVKKAVQWLLKTQLENGEWKEDEFTATGFPNAFYLRYDFYRIYFPLMALSEYRKGITYITPYEGITTLQGRETLRFVNNFD
jgi:squalene-hopene/tetraprenyl-beta-curcumene cyclase